MKRLDRKNDKTIDLGIKSAGMINDLFDNEIKLAFRITDEEYDYMAEKMTDEELGLLLEEKRTFAEKRKLIKMLDEYLKKYCNTKLK